MHIIGYLLAGLVGISLGLIGGGGSILTVPILVYLFGIDPVLATSYSLLIVGTTSLAGAVKNYFAGMVSIKTALFFGMASITTVFITRKIIVPAVPSVWLNTQHLLITQSIATMLLFAILMIAAAIAMISNKKTIISVQHLPLKKSKGQLLLIGMLIGFATGMLGAGGGFLIIPALVILLKMHMKLAVGTSLLIIALNSLIGFTGDWGHFNYDWTFLSTMIVLSVAGIFAGVGLSKKIDGHKLKKAFGWFVLLMGFVIIIKEIFFTNLIH